MEPFAFAIPVTMPFEKAVTRVTDILKDEGFGVLTSIDVKATFQEKLGVDFRKYAILGVCNPTLAHQALSADPEAGLLLPCTVTVEETGPEESLVRIANPEAMLQAGHFAEGGVIRSVAAQARGRLNRVADRLAERILQP